MGRITAKMPGKKEFDKWGQILGRVELPPELLPKFGTIVGQYYDQAEANDFSGDDVETLALPDWLPSSQECAWFPDLSATGFALHGGGELLVATLGVDPHADFHGPVLMLTLHNDGLGFRQGKARHKPTAGDWFIFNDLADHAMSSAKGRAAFLGWHVPLTWTRAPERPS